MTSVFDTSDRWALSTNTSGHLKKHNSEVFQLWISVEELFVETISCTCLSRFSYVSLRFTVIFVSYGGYLHKNVWINYSSRERSVDRTVGLKSSARPFVRSGTSGAFTGDIHHRTSVHDRMAPRRCHFLTASWVSVSQNFFPSNFELNPRGLNRDIQSD